MQGTNCEDCEYCDYDEEFDSYTCEFLEDEDDAARAAYCGARYVCPHFSYRNEYRVVKKQN